MPEATEVQYLVLPDSTNPYLLARVRWPDVAQAISSGCSEWQQDSGLFDLPYDPACERVTADEAAAIASRWGATLSYKVPAGTFGHSLIRRMPADWSNLTLAERRAWYLELLPTPSPAPGDSRRRGSLAGASQAGGRRSPLLRALGRSQDRANPAPPARHLATEPTSGTAHPESRSTLNEAEILDSDGRLKPLSALERNAFEPENGLGIAPDDAWPGDDDIGAGSVSTNGALLTESHVSS